jgi:NAD(P)-dependent dehydrogenase (short-subunit alcohol dehydrogenase family)
MADTSFDTQLDGKTIVVGGGTGDVGVAIVGVLTEAGARVIVPTRSPEKADTLREGLSHPDRLEVVESDFEDEDSVHALRNALLAFGPLDGAIASLGSWFTFGSLAETSLVQMDRAYRSLLRTHVMFARAAAPLLENGTYVIVNGGASVEPVPNSAAVSIMTRGLTMVAETLEAEHEDLRVHTLLLRSMIAKRARDNPDPAWVTAEEVGEAAAWLFSPIGQLTAGSTVTLTARDGPPS